MAEAHTHDSGDHESTRYHLADGIGQPEVNAYAEWNLAEVLARDSDRLTAFFAHRKVFDSPESAAAFEGEVRAAAQLDIAPEEQIRHLHRVFRTFPEAARYEAGDIVRARARGERMVRTLGGVIFPTRSDRPTSFIDVGCGLAETTSVMADHWGVQPEQARGFDIFQPSQTPSNVRFEQMTTDQLPANVKPYSQDLAVVSMVLHHSTNPERLMAGVAQALKPGGCLVVREHDATPELTEFLNTVHVFYEQVFPARPFLAPNAQNYRSLDEWRTDIEAQGLIALKVKNEPYPENPVNTSNNLTMIFQKHELF